MEPATEKVLRRAIKQAHFIATPIMPPTDFALVAWAGEMEQLECHTSRYGFVRAQSYDVESGSYSFVMLTD